MKKMDIHDFILNVYINDIKDVKKAIKQGIDVNAFDKNGDTALITAIYEDNLEIVKLLIDNGADVNLEDKNGNKPLMIANQQMVHSEIVKLLKEKGAK